MSLCALIVDDEPVARAGLASMVRVDADFSTILECGDRHTAAEVIRTKRPDVVLLDIQLNPGTGFDLIQDIGVDNMPRVIFVTAFDRFALKAFDAAAIDYVVKPVSRARLHVALERAKTQLRANSVADASARLLALAQELGPRERRPIAVMDGDRTLLFEPNEIVWIEAADYYAKIYARGRSWLVRETLDALESRLQRPFFRVHRSAIVNLRFVLELSRVTRHRSTVVLRDGTKIPVSQERRRALDEWLIGAG